MTEKQNVKEMQAAGELKIIIKWERKVKDFLTGPSIANTVPVGFALSLANH